MTENTKKFLEVISKNDELTAKVSNMTKEELVALANELGIVLTEADFENPDGELNDDELDTVAGGGDCYCFAGGGGKKSGVNNVCACVVYGTGSYVQGTDDVYQRCVCPLCGTGESW